MESEALPASHTRRMYRRTLLVLIGLLFPLISQAWNGPGHMITGIIAYRQMPEASRDFIADWLRRHRRFDEDFSALMPSIPTEDRDMWIFAHAATWPDIARSFNHLNNQPAGNELIAQYHRSRWHYVNLPTFLGAFERNQLVPVPANLDMAWTPG
jgi:hypothetical protein